MYSTRSTLAAASIAAAALTAAPGLAGAATLTADKACYIDAGSVGRQPITTTASGLTPGGRYNVGFKSSTGSETGYSFGNADGAGNWVGQMPSWYGGSIAEPKSYNVKLVLRDSATGAELASVDTKTAGIAISVTGKSKNRSWKISGLAALTGGTTYYAHYFNNNKYKGRLKLGKPSGPCGVYKGKRPLTPFSKLGRYDVKVTTTRKWNEGDAHIPGRVTVTRRY